MQPIQLSELIETLEFDFPDYSTRVDLLNGCVVQLPVSLLSAMEDGDEKAADAVGDWEKEEVEIARAVVGDSGERFVAAPNKFDFHEYRHLERFIGTVENAEAAEQLLRAIKGKGAFRYFKDTASRLGLLEQWYRYRADVMKEFVRDWAEAKKVPYVDDLEERKL